jgi:flagellar hook protein FlgE
MGIFGALNTAVAGLRAQSYAMENISGNIANSQTIGFKRVDTTFIDLVAERPRRQGLSGSVIGIGQQAITLQGDIRPTGVTTNLAINGSGFFSVSELAGNIDGNPVFGETNLFTRRGDFQLNKDGYLVNGSGMYLRGDSINLDGLVTSTNGVVRVSDQSIPAAATSELRYSAVLPQTAGTNAYDGAPGTDQIDAGGAGAPNGFAAGTTTISAEESARFLARSISGGSTVLYTASGARIDLQMRWAKETDNEWRLFMQQDARATGPDAMWTSLGTATFNADGTLAAATLEFPAAPFLINGTEAPNPLGVAIGTQGLRQYSTPSNQLQALRVETDGYPPGSLQDIDVASDGRIIGLYNNGQNVALARLSLAQFAAPNMLKGRDGGAFEATIESGEPVISSEGAQLVSGAVEQSNADIAEEFSKMIVTQQSYSANTRVVTTAQQMMEQTINMVR